MSKAVYIFKEHENFQPGKTKLQKGAVFQRSIIWLVFGIPFSLTLLWFAGPSLRQAWLYTQMGEETTGKIIDSYGASFETCTINYEYEVEGIFYSAQDVVSQSCLAYGEGQEEEVSYLINNPQQSITNASSTKDMWLISTFCATFGILGIMACFGLMSRNRIEQLLYTQLCRSETIIEGKVYKVAVGGSAKSNYKYADYHFTSPDMGILSGQIRSGRGYRWPEELVTGDTLYILYLDDKTYCVL